MVCIAPRSRRGGRFRSAIALPLALLVATALLSAATRARATVVERVVAVIGERAILLSDLRERARPFMAKIYDQVPSGARRNAALSQLYKALLQRMIDEELEQRAATRAHIVVSAVEVDKALARIAAQNGISVEKLVQEAEASGLTEPQYRREVRHQVLEAKLLNLRLQGRIRVTPEDVRTAYRRIVVNERRKLSFRAAWIKLSAPRSLSGPALEARRALADHIARMARQGADFATLARRYSDDAATRKTGGLLGEKKPGQLPAVVDRVALGMEVGEVSPPLRVGDELVIVKLVERADTDLPTLADARDELSERVYLDKMNKARRRWLDSLRRRTHVEVRL
jgi:peptidyl-prolyl cis-trans isomerase SurA